MFLFIFKFISSLIIIFAGTAFDSLNHRVNCVSVIVIKSAISEIERFSYIICHLKRLYCFGIHFCDRKSDEAKYCFRIIERMSENIVKLMWRDHDSVCFNRQNANVMNIYALNVALTFFSHFFSYSFCFKRTLLSINYETDCCTSPTFIKLTNIFGVWIKVP